MIISSLWRRWHLGHCILSLVSVTEDRLSAVTIMLQQDWGHMSSQGVYGTGKLYLPFPLLFFPFSFPFCCIPPFSSVSSPSFLFLTISHDPLLLLVSWLPDSCSYTQISPAQQKHEVLWLDRFRSPAQPKQITLWVEYASLGVSPVVELGVVQLRQNHMDSRREIGYVRTVEEKNGHCGTV